MISAMRFSDAIHLYAVEITKDEKLFRKVLDKDVRFLTNIFSLVLDIPPMPMHTRVLISKDRSTSIVIMCPALDGVDAKSVMDDIKEEIFREGTDDWVSLDFMRSAINSILDSINLYRLKNLSEAYKPYAKGMLTKIGGRYYLATEDDLSEFYDADTVPGVGKAYFLEHEDAVLVDDVRKLRRG